MENPANRILLAFKNWEEHKKDLDPLLKTGAADGTALAHLQLEHLRQARHRLHEQVRRDEKPFMILLHSQIARLEKQLYPNSLPRIFFRWKDKLSKAISAAKR